MHKSRLNFGSMFILAVTILVAMLTIGGSSLADDANMAASDVTEILYVTNRSPITLEDGEYSYAADRSHSLAFGAIHAFGRDAASSSLSAPIELGRFPDTPYPLEKVKDHYIRSRRIISEHIKTQNAFHNELSKRITYSKRKEVILFIHGYNNTFDDAAKSTAQLCNDIGIAEFVCIAFTWPAGGTKGVLFGYNVDRESGEFSVPDLRKTIRMIADTNGVKKIHFIAHSRGADVLASTLQQLGIEAYSERSYTAKRFKYENIILAAPDLDIDVAYTRIRGIVSDPDLPYGGSVNYRAPFYPEQIRLTIYASSNDKALNVSKELFGSDIRLGQMAAETHDIADSRTNGAAEYISVNDEADILGHSYFLSNPAVRKDIVSIIRDHIKAGDEGRSLIEVKKRFWQLVQ